MNIRAILLALHLGAGHRIVTIQTRAGKLFNECQLESVDSFSGSIRFWVDTNLTGVSADDIVAIHVSDLTGDPMSWVDERLLQQAA